MTQVFVWVLVAVSTMHGTLVRDHVAVSTMHGTLVRDHVAVFAKSETCYEARKSMEYYSSDKKYFCQQEILK